ncbi:cytochrome P450 [Arthrobacter sp. MI7-26]|uniref:cytochrome P450 n=1 Tax=Arthrobacter sp. MI7-26 TaxID=2993653 RepID=UPI002248DF8C|nr:cytochrome P450 [Arthrobacter sp. MI7-26]MCX2750335.1 cytochrome P450 [Arthrobacter sp. MI7-26]
MTTQDAQCPFHGNSETRGDDADSARASQHQVHTIPSQEAADYPVADWVDVAALASDPYPIYARLRAESPVAWVPQLNKFLVTNYAGCHAVEQDQEIFSANVSGATMTRAIGAQPMLRKDDPEHSADRAPVNPVLRPKSIKEVWGPVFEGNAETYLEKVAEIGPHEADLNRDYAAPVASQNLIDLLGLKDVSVEQVRRWSHAFIAGMGNVLDDPAIWERCDASTEEADRLLEELIPYYRQNPDASMVSAWANSGLPASNVAANVKLTISGGMNEPQHMVTNMVWALSNHPEQSALVFTDPLLWAAAFDEAVRWQSPIGMYPRETTRETILEGVRIPAGAGIGVVVASANHDEAHFGDSAADFDINRPKRPHLAFGSGVHLCAGHWAAKTSIGQIAVPMAYKRFPGLRVDKQRNESWDGWVFRGLTSLPVTWN